MTIPDLLSVFSTLDLAALAILIAVWWGSGWVTEHPPRARPSTTVLMSRYRHEWMVQMITRQPRIFDAAILSSLKQGTTFLASGAMLAVGGVLALAGNAEPLTQIVDEVGVEAHPSLFWQGKLAVIALLLTHSVFRFVWSNRLFGYCAVVMASVPNDANDPRALPRAAKAAEINVRAALNYNSGLRSVYFAFATLGWLIGPWTLLASVAVTAWVVLGREFRSASRGVLLED